MSGWTEADLTVIREAADNPEQGLQRLTEHFEPQGVMKLIEACGAADKLVASRTTEARRAGASADAGLVLTRDFGPIAHKMREVW